MAGLSAGLAAGYLLAQHVGISSCSEEEQRGGAVHGHGAEKPPLHVKPVPIVRNTASKPEQGGADDTPQEDTE